MSRPRQRRAESGFTLIELTIALVLGLVVVMALGQLIIANQRSFEWGRDKVVLQQNSTEALEWMARSVRAATSLAVVDSTQLSTYDDAGTLLHTYALVNVGGVNRLHQDGADLVDRRVTRFLVIPDADTTSVSITLELEARAGSRVQAFTRVMLRNRSFEF